MKAQESTDFQNKIFQSALDYAALGWHVFPIFDVIGGGVCTCPLGANCTDAGKHPRNHQGLNAATTDVEKIEAWFGLGCPSSNIGIRTGEISDLTVIDIDVGEKGGSLTWAKLIEGPGQPLTLMVTTGSGGMHFYFKYNSALPTKQNALGKGVDCRNDGGYVVAPPSRHKSGNSYCWDNWDTPLAPLPPHLSRIKDKRGRPRKDDARRKQYSIEEVAEMLESIPADNRDDWRNVGIILGREFKCAEPAWKVYVDWANRWSGRKGRNHDEIMHESFYVISQEPAKGDELSVGSIVGKAIEHGWAPTSGQVPVERFVFNGPGNNFIYRPTTSYWISAAVDAAVSPVNNGQGKLLKASDWLRKNQLVTSCTVDPTVELDYLKGFDCKNGEIVEVEGAAMFNFYRRPTIALGSVKKAQPFIDHCYKIFDKPGDTDQFLDYMAHRVQSPGVKPRFALLVAGDQGIGKDTAIEFCVPAIGVWNVAAIEPEAFDSGFNEYVAKTLVRINEAANLHEMSKWAFNERTKVLIAGSPDHVTVNPKYGTKFEVRMFCGVIVTTNHLMNGIYIPEGDRRFDVIECATMAKMELEDENVRREYFSKLWRWFIEEEGDRHVAAFLTKRDISRFDPNQGQRKTAAHKSVVAINLTSDGWLEDALEDLGKPDAVCAAIVLQRAVAKGENEAALRTKLSSAMGRAGYCLFANPERKDGRWTLDGQRCIVYAKVGIEQNSALLSRISNGPRPTGF